MLSDRPGALRQGAGLSIILGRSLGLSPDVARRTDSTKLQRIDMSQVVVTTLSESRPTRCLL